MSDPYAPKIPLTKSEVEFMDKIVIEVTVALIEINHNYDSDAEMAEDVYDIADAMLAERTKRGVL